MNMVFEKRKKKKIFYTLFFSEFHILECLRVQRTESGCPNNFYVRFLQQFSTTNTMTETRCLKKAELGISSGVALILIISVPVKNMKFLLLKSSMLALNPVFCCPLTHRWYFFEAIFFENQQRKFLEFTFCQCPLWSTKSEIYKFAESLLNFSRPALV